jgi:hypothetical protein
MSGHVVIIRLVEEGADVEVLTILEDEVPYGTLRDGVDGYIERVALRTPEFPQEDAPKPFDFDLWVNEEGLLRGLTPSPLATSLAQACGWRGDLLVGNAVVTGGTGPEGETLPLTEEQLAVIMAFFSTMQRLMLFEAFATIAPDEEPEGMTDVEADADTLASAGYGTDEDYGLYESGDVP